MLDPAILQSIRTAWTHLCTRTLVRHSAESTGARPAFEPLDPGTCVAILKRPEVRSIEERVNQLALAGDILGTQRACQDWNSACRKAVEEITS